MVEAHDSFLVHEKVESMINRAYNPNVNDRYAFDWDMLDVIIGGKSSMDLSRLDINNLEEAETFLKIYGYDLRKSYVQNEIRNIFNESVAFLENTLVPDPISKEISLEIPNEIKFEEDIRKIFLIASNMSDENQPWACATLRVMHTISHINNDISLKFFPEIQRQILERFWSAVYVDSKGQKYFGLDETGIRINDLQIKASKERHSMIIKLLHKQENVAADVFDKVGVRIITYDKVDTLLIIRYLRRNGILAFPNIKPSRSINKLLDIKSFKKTFGHLKNKYEDGEFTEEEFENILREQCEEISKKDIEDDSDNDNLFSSKSYRSIQFTCRQMIRMRYPILADNSKGININNSFKDDYSFFFPYEVQILDKKTHFTNISGKASHVKYKQKQLITARKRVLGKLLVSSK